MSEKSTNNESVSLIESQDKKPNESGGFYFSSSVKITDPNSKEVLLQQRGDN